MLFPIYYLKIQNNKKSKNFITMSCHKEKTVHLMSSCYILSLALELYVLHSMEEVLTNEDTVRAGWLLLVAQVSRYV